MNYFGLFFSFMIPGVVIGTMAASAVKEAAAKKGRRAKGRVIRLNRAIWQFQNQSLPVPAGKNQLNMRHL